VPLFVVCSVANDRQNQIGLKDTERKPLGVGVVVTHSTMSSAVQTLAQVKERTSIMAIVVYSCC
jgi:hypothetical protein